MAQPLLPLPDFCTGRVTEFSGDAAVLVSGGSDSVALLQLVARHRVGRWRRLRVLHFDHGLRQSSGSDAKFVMHVSRQLGLPCDVLAMDAGMLRHDPAGIQAAAREARRTAAMSYIAQHRLSWILQGHTADDQDETLIAQGLRSRGLQDRKGMLAASGPIVRPLLDIRRVELQHWLELCGQKWCTDSSNDSDDYQRNYIRHHIRPQLEILGDMRRLQYGALQARQLWLRAHADLMRRTGASPSTALALRINAARSIGEQAVVSLWAGARGLRPTRDHWNALWNTLHVQLDVAGGRLFRADGWLWSLRPHDLPDLELSVSKWLALDKETSVPILASGVGYPPGSAFGLARGRVSAQQVFCSAHVPPSLRARVGWKLHSTGVHVFPAAKDGLRAVHLLP